MICSQCGGKHFHKKGILDGVQQYKCVTRSKSGSTCGCRKPPIFVTEEEESEFLELQDENIRLAKKTQKYQDVNRIKNKAFRETTRVDNSVIEYSRAIRDAIKENPNIKELDLISNNLTDKGLIALAEAFKGNPNLTVIGHITEKNEGTHLITRANQKIELIAQGWNGMMGEE